MESLRDLPASDLQSAGERRAALGRTVHEGLPTPRPILPKWFLPPEFAKADMLHRLGTFHVDQAVSIPIPPLHRLEHFRKQTRSNSWTHVGITPDGNPASTSPRGFSLGRRERPNAVELFAQAFWSFTRPYHVPQDFERCRSPRIPTLKPSSTWDLIQRIEFHSARGGGYISVVEKPLRPGR